MPASNAGMIAGRQPSVCFRFRKNNPIPARTNTEGIDSHIAKAPIPAAQTGRNARSVKRMANATSASTTARSQPYCFPSVA